MELIKAELYLKNGNVVNVVTTEKSLNYFLENDHETTIIAYEQVTQPMAKIISNGTTMSLVDTSTHTYVASGYVSLFETPDAVTVYKLF